MHKELPEPEQVKLSVSLVDPCWEVLDPNPNIHDLFLTFNDQFFWGRLSGIEVKWSPRMTLCAGICSYGIGGLCSVRLSLPLLKFRPRKDLVETLLHEMIHAYLFVTHNNSDHDGHGQQFCKHMNRINKIASVNISVYHTFLDEVDAYRQHIWQCDGPCRKKPPYFGLVKRSMNRPPAKSDFWWNEHQNSCGGTYRKIKEPPNYSDSKKPNKKAKGANKLDCPDIRKYFNDSEVNIKSLESKKDDSIINSSGKNTLKTENNDSRRGITDLGNDSRKHEMFVAFTGKSHSLTPSSSSTQNDESKTESCGSGNCEYLECPLCCTKIKLGNFDNHISECMGNFDMQNEGKLGTNETNNDDYEMSSSSIIVDCENDEEYALIVDNKYPCPICGEEFFESILNPHVNQHFT